MSWILKNEELEDRLKDRPLSNIVETINRDLYYVDSVKLSYAELADWPYETMAFRAYRNSSGVVCVDDWDEVACRIYKTEEEMIAGHKHYCEHLEELLYER